MTNDLVEMARLAQHDERMATGALYGNLADRIEELSNCVAVLEANLRKSALQELSALGQASEAYQAQLAAEAKLAKAVAAMQFWSEAVEPDVDKAITLMASTLAELKGQGDE